MGNILHESVPVSKDEAENAIVRTHGGQPRPALPAEGEVLHHHELLHMIDGYESERGVKTAGHRAYFLKGPGLILNLALIQYGLEFLRSRGYTPVQPPFFMNKDVMAAVAQLDDFDEQLYKVIGEGDDEKYLIATSEQPMCSLHRGEWLEEKALPIRYAGWSSCFRKEAGSHGKDTWGIFRVHQFDKIEQFAITEPEKSWEMHEEMMAVAEEFYQSLGLAYRVVTIVSGELNNAAAKKYDLEAWFPGFEEYRELVSCSNCTDYQSRGMETRCGAKKKGDRAKKYVHMLNSTLCATTRTICCILENFQTADGVQVPEVLVPYTGGVTFFPFVNEKPENVSEKKMAKAAEKKAKAAEGGAPSAAPPAAAPARGGGGGGGGGDAGGEGGKKGKKGKKKEARAAAGGGGGGGGGAAVAAPPVPAAAAPAPVARGGRVSLATEAGLADLEARLTRQSYVEGFEASAEDVIVAVELQYALLKAGKAAPDATYPHTTRWLRHIQALPEAQRRALLATKTGPAESKFFTA